MKPTWCSDAIGLMLKAICILQLEEHIVRLREELDREREERNYFQLERDKIHTFWEITKRDLDDKKAELRNRDREIEEAEERHQAEIKVQKYILLPLSFIVQHLGLVKLFMNS